MNIDGGTIGAVLIAVLITVSANPKAVVDARAVTLHGYLACSHDAENLICSAVLARADTASSIAPIVAAFLATARYEDAVSIFASLAALATLAA